MPAEPSVNRQIDGRLAVGRAKVWAMAIAACKQKQKGDRCQRDTLKTSCQKSEKHMRYEFYSKERCTTESDTSCY